MSRAGGHNFQYLESHLDQSEIHGIYNRIRKSETIFMVLFVIRPTRRKMLEKGVQWVLQIRDDSFF